MHRLAADANHPTVEASDHPRVAAGPPPYNQPTRRKRQYIRPQVLAITPSAAG